MIEYTGQGASAGLAIGKIKIINRRIRGFKRVLLTAGREWALYQAAVRRAKDEISVLAQGRGKSQREILNFQMMLLEDDSLNLMIKEYIAAGMGAARATEKAMDEYCARLEGTKDEYFVRRNIDIRDALSRVIDILDGRDRVDFTLTAPRIIIADEILPSDLAAFDRRYTLGFVTVEGSRQSHSNILARTMNVPSVFGVDSEILNPLNEGRTACVDGAAGQVCISPTESVLTRYKHMIALGRRKSRNAEILKEKPLVTKDGKQISIMANCNDPREIARRIKNGAAGVGLVRSEIMLLNGNIPTQAQQEEFYGECIRAAAGLPLTVRLFDLGRDKTSEILNFRKEPNPALGTRGIRLLHVRESLFISQIRALYIAADKEGKIKVMIPMITTLKDISDILSLAKNIKAELLSDNIIKNDNVSWGAMIETPSAALISEELAHTADFFSVGTNDLIQYTMAADRMNSHVNIYYDPLSDGVMKLVKITADSAKNHGIPITVCGESAAMPQAAKQYIKMGITNLSMAQSSVIPLKIALNDYIEKGEI
jgi:phosphotransferase system enzyme I (PtsI)